MFKIGDKVKYVSGKHGSNKDNPLYKDTGAIGTIYHISKEWYNVKFDTGADNSYNEKDLEHYVTNLFTEDFLI